MEENPLSGDDDLRELVVQPVNFDIGSIFVFSMQSLPKKSMEWDFCDNIDSMFVGCRVGTNLLVYSHREDSKFHAPAKECIDSLRHQSAPWAIAWPCVHEFIGIVTRPGIYQPPTSLNQALAAVDAWLAGGNLHLLSESPGYFEKLRELALAAKLSGPRIATFPCSRSSKPAIRW
jgi:predicted nucleic acid-binding protein